MAEPVCIETTTGVLITAPILTYYREQIRLERELLGETKVRISMLQEVNRNRTKRIVELHSAIEKLLRTVEK